VREGPQTRCATGLAEGARDRHEYLILMHQAQTENRSTFRRLAQRIRVPAGFLLAPLLILAAQPTPRSLLTGAALSLVGLSIRAWASGYLKKNQELTTGGPYAPTRNPLYLGSFLIGLGFTIAAGRWLLAVLFAALFLGIYVPVMRVESATLEKLFGHKYRRYAQAVPLFVPRLKGYSEAGGTKFDAALYKRYREYQAALGFLIAFVALAFKAWYFGY